MAEIITTIDFGRHNADLHAANARLNMEGTWKRQRIVHILPTGKKGVPNKVLASLMGMISPPNQAKVPLVIEEAEVGAAYEQAIRLILGNENLREFEYVLTTEHDNVIPPLGLLGLIKHLEARPEIGAVSALYWTKGETGVPQIWGDINDPTVNYRPQPPRPGELVECYGIGMGMSLYRMQMFRDLEAKKVPSPWFETIADHRGTGTQDLAFCGMARREVGARFAVACDVLVGHLDVATGICW